MTSVKMSTEYRIFPNIDASENEPPLAPGSKARIGATTSFLDNQNFVPSAGKHSKPSMLPISMYRDRGHTAFTRMCKICQREIDKEDPSVKHVCGYAFHSMCADVYLKNCRAPGSHCKIITCPACNCLLENRGDIDGESANASEPRRSNTIKSLQRASSKIVKALKRALTVEPRERPAFEEARRQVKKDLKTIAVSKPSKQQSKTAITHTNGVPPRKPLPKDAKVQVKIKSGPLPPMPEPPPLPPKPKAATVLDSGWVREGAASEPSGDLTEQNKHEEYSNIFYYQ